MNTPQLIFATFGLQTNLDEMMIILTTVICKKEMTSSNKCNTFICIYIYFKFVYYTKLIEFLLPNLWTEENCNNSWTVKIETYLFLSKQCQYVENET